MFHAMESEASFEECSKVPPQIQGAIRELENEEVSIEFDKLDTENFDFEDADEAKEFINTLKLMNHLPETYEKLAESIMSE